MVIIMALYSKVGVMDEVIPKKDTQEYAVFSKWKNMLVRCYEKSYQAKKPTYIGCSVCSEWLTFSNFKNWISDKDWVGKEIDKDILIPGNKVYSPQSCMLVSKMVNSFCKPEKIKKDGLPVGVHFYKATGRYQAYVQNPVSKKRLSLGYFSNLSEAKAAVNEIKKEFAKEVISIESDQAVISALKKLYGV